jgi:hypothetical protein
MTTRIIVGHVLDKLRELPANSVHCVVTSPPYWGLRDYGTPLQIWGGDPGCEHKWGGEICPKEQTGGGNNKSNIGSFHSGNPSFFCVRCGAWRGSLGLEPDYRAYVAHIVEIFRDVRRVLRPDGTCWIVIGDSYYTNAGKVGDRPGGGLQGDRWAGHESIRQLGIGPMTQPNRLPQICLKPKDLVGIPWRVALHFKMTAGGYGRISSGLSQIRCQRA